LRRVLSFSNLVMVVMAMAVIGAGCGSSTSGEVSSGRVGNVTTLKVMVPCGQVGPFSEIVKAYQEKYPEIEVEWIPENMVTITRKLLAGKDRADVVLSMGDRELNLLQDGGLLMDGTRVRYAENSLAIMVPADNPANVHGMDDLVKSEVKTITIPDPKENSAGVHAVDALKNAGIWERVEKKVLFAQYAADSKDVAAKGQAQASIGYYPCAVEVHIPGQPPAQPKNLKMVCQVSPDVYGPFYCEGVVLKDSENVDAAKKLLEFLQTSDSQEVFKIWKFIGDASTCAAE